MIDSGIGFDESSLSHLFKPFTKNDTPSPGGGLGLHITKTLVTSMGGRLELRSEAGVGTTFMVTIPVKLEEPGPRVESRSIRLVLKEKWSKNGRAETNKAVSNGHPEPPITRGHVRHHVTELPQSPSGVTKRRNGHEPLRVLVVDDNTICRKLLIMAFKRSPDRSHLRSSREWSTCPLCILPTQPRPRPHRCLDVRSWMGSPLLVRCGRSVVRKVGDHVRSTPSRVWEVLIRGRNLLG